MADEPTADAPRHAAIDPICQGSVTGRGVPAQLLAQGFFGSNDRRPVGDPDAYFPIERHAVRPLALQHSPYRFRAAVHQGTEADAGEHRGGAKRDSALTD